MRDHSQHIEISRDQAVQAMLEALAEGGFQQRARDRAERVAVQEAYGRVLAQDVHAKTDLPNALTCCLDSVAVHWDDFASLAPGEVPDTSSWVRGRDWQFANTGIAMPEGFDTAIVIEHVEVLDGEERIRLKAAPSERFAGTRAAGSKMKRGQLAVRSGCLIDADVASAIMQAGHSSVEVLPRPRVAFVPTGNELVPANLPFSQAAPASYAGRGRVFESNGALVRGNVERWGGVVAPFDIVPDEYEAIKAALSQAVATADIVVLNAGSSKGSDDWSVEVLDEMGTMICHQVNHGPGHHSFYAVVDGTPVVGISGPPGGVSFTLGFYLYPVMRAWLGLPTAQRTVHAVLDGSFGENKHGRQKEPRALFGEQRPPEAASPGALFYSVRFMELRVDGEGVVRARPLPGKAGSDTAREADAVYLLASGPDAVYPQPGEVIQVELRP